MNSVERLAKVVSSLAREVKGLASASQLAHSSLEGGSIDEYDDDDNLVAQYGEQFDGTHAAISLSGPTPPTPTPAFLNGERLTLSVRWDGFFVDEFGEADELIFAPQDFTRVEVHASQDPLLTAEFAETIIGTIETPRGGEVAVSAPKGTHYVRLVTRTLSGKASTPPSAVVSVEVVPLVDTDLIISEIDAAHTEIRNAGYAYLAEGVTLDQELTSAKTARDQVAGELETLKTVTLPGLDTELSGATGRLATAEQELDAAFGRIDTAETTLAAVPADIATAKQAAINAAALTAQTKADAAKAAAVTAAAADATSKAEAAEAAAAATAALDAQSKADAAKAAAIAAADTAADLAIQNANATVLAAAETKAKELADAAEVAAETAAALDATSKAEAAEAAAAATAALDATAKANQAKTDAISAAAITAQAKADAAKAAAITAAATDATAKAEQAEADAAIEAARVAKEKADAAQTAAVNAAAITAQLKADGAKTAAINAAAITAQSKADAAKTAAVTAAALDAAAKDEVLEATAATEAARVAKEKADAALVSANEATALVEDRAISRGTDLVTNGTGLLGNNYNFSTFTFDPADSPAGASGGFVVASTGRPATRNSDEAVPVSTNKTYALSVTMRERNAALTNSRSYVGLVPEDGLGRAISPQMYAYDPATATTLAAPLNPGATTASLTEIKGTWLAAAHISYLGIWNWKDEAGKVWPLGTYTRLYPKIDSISGTTVTFNAPYSGPAMPAGTPVTNNASGGSYMYVAASNRLLNPQWQTFTGTVGPGVHDGAQIKAATNQLPPGTAQTRILFLPNYQGEANSEQVYALLSFSDATAAQQTANAAVSRVAQAELDLTSAKGRLDAAETFRTSAELQLASANTAINTTFPARFNTVEQDLSEVPTAIDTKITEAKPGILTTAAATADTKITAAKPGILTEAATTADTKITAAKPGILTEAGTAADSKITAATPGILATAGTTADTKIATAKTATLAEAATAADAKITVMSNGVSQSISSTAAPTTTNKAPKGSIWRRVDGAGKILGIWEQTATGVAGTWTSRAIRSEVIDALDVGKLTAVTGSINDLVANNFAARTSHLIEANIGKLVVTGDTHLADATARRIAADSGQFVELSVGQLTVPGTATITTAVANHLAAKTSSLIEADIGKLTVTGTTNLNTAVAERIGANVGQFIELGVDQLVVSGSANINTAVIDAFVADSAFINKLRTNVLTVGSVPANAVKDLAASQITGLETSLDSKLPAVISGAGQSKTFNAPLQWQQTGSGITGSIVIDTPITVSNKMCTIRIAGYNYRGSRTEIDVTVGFYATSNTSGPIATHSQTSAGSAPVTARIGRKTATGTVSIILDTPMDAGLWYYPQISVPQAVIGYTETPDTWIDGWSASIKTDLTAYDSLVSPPSRDLNSTHELTQGWRSTGTTTIDGGKITADSVKAGQVYVDGTLWAKFANVVKITAGMMEADSVKAGNLDANAITAKHKLTGPLIQTSTAPNTGLKIDSAGNTLRMWDATGRLMIDASGTTGNLGLAGILKSSAPSEDRDGDPITLTLSAGGAVPINSTATGTALNVPGLVWDSTATVFQMVQPPSVHSTNGEGLTLSSGVNSGNSYSEIDLYYGEATINAQGTVTLTSQQSAIVLAGSQIALNAPVATNFSMHVGGGVNEAMTFGADSQNRTVLRNPSGADFTFANLGGGYSDIAFNEADIYGGRMQFMNSLPGYPHVFLQANDTFVFAKVNSTTRQNIDCARIDAGSIYSPDTYGSTTTANANIYVGSGGHLRRSTSARKYKLAIDPLAIDDDKLLSITPSTWFDKNQSEAVAAYYDAEYLGDPLVDEMGRPLFDAPAELKRIPGVVAEEVEAAGLSEFVIYGDDGQVEGVMYDRLGVALIPVVKRLREQVAEQEVRLAKLEAQMLQLLPPVEEVAA